MRIDIVTIFPDYLAPLGLSLIGRARAAGLLDVHVHDLRDWARDRHRSVDDPPYGGGAGMVMGAPVWGAALDSVRAAFLDSSGGTADPSPRVVVPSPAGRPLTQLLAAELATEPWLILPCGRYEGVDQRVVEDAAKHGRTDEVSIGDYVVGGGEVAALVIVEAVARLLPGVLGNAESLREESHGDGLQGLLEPPVYTRPPVWRGLEVPAVLLSGDHGAIARWRRDEALRRTALRRPDLLRRIDASGLGRRDLEVLAGLGWFRDADRLVTGGPAVAD